MENIYEDLRRKLDGMSKGFPKSKGGAEYRALKSLFSPEDAEYAVALIADFETPAQVAARMGRDVETVAAKLQDMSKRGLIYRVRKGKETQYRLMPWIVGIWEYQVNKGAQNMELLSAIRQYFGQGLGNTIWSGKTPLFRTLPVNTEIVSDSKVLPSDDVMKILDSKERFAVARCLCRQMTLARGRPCRHENHPLETCLALDDWGDYLVENGDARYITREEAEALLRLNEKEGLVMLTSNSSESIDFICSCCSCCCGALTVMNNFPSPSREFAGNYVCRLDTSLCVKEQGCSACTERCQVFAHKMVDGNARYNQDLCIGCGLCITACPAKALRLEIKPQEKLNKPPKTTFEMLKIVEAERLDKR